MSDLAFGCSHTFGVGVDTHQAWPALLKLVNYGQVGVSADYIARILPNIATQSTAKKIFILWPDWTRFEYLKGHKILQSLATDKNRIEFMEDWPDERLRKNFNNQVQSVKNFCSQQNIKLIDMTLDDLIPYIDHADRWPVSKLGHHYSPVWHQWVADIFRQRDNEQT